MGNLVRKMSFVGKKGDTMHIPMPARGAVYAKVAGAAVTLQTAVESEITVVINKHYEYSKLIEDFAAVQALNSSRQFYTGDAGYQLAKQVDRDLIKLGRVAMGGTDAGVDAQDAYAAAVIGGDGTTAYTSASYNASALTDAGIRRVIQTLDDNDVPMDGRHLVIPPVTRNTMMGLSRFTEQAFVGESASGNTIRNGQIGNVYGIDVYVTTNCDTGDRGSSTKPRICLMFHEDALVLAMQQNIRSQSQYKQEYLATLYTGDVIYGVKGLRTSATSTDPNASGMVAIAVPG